MAKNKNFFEINPIYPKASDQEYKLYGINRKRVSFLEYAYKVHATSMLGQTQEGDENELYLRKAYGGQ